MLDGGSAAATDRAEPGRAGPNRRAAGSRWQHRPGLRPPPRCGTRARPAVRVRSWSTARGCQQLRVLKSDGTAQALLMAEAAAEMAGD